MGNALIEAIVKYRLMVVIRLHRPDFLEEVIDGLVEAGVRVLEITSNTPGWLKAISAARIRHPAVWVGAGTVTDVALADRALDAGAQFLVSPNTDKGLAGRAQASNVPIMMGALTPTEVGSAIAFGADLIKLYPAGSFGTAYYKALKGPFDRAPFIAVGGIGSHNIEDWLSTGIAAVALGSSLVPPDIQSACQVKDMKKEVLELMKLGIV